MRGETKKVRIDNLDFLNEVEQKIKYIKYNIRVAEEISKKIEELSAEKGISKSMVIERIIKHTLGEV